MSYQKKKIIKILLTIVVLFLLFLIVYISPRNYEVKYKKNGLEIIEIYNKKNKSYQISFKYDDKIFKMISFSDYSKSRKVIDKIDILKDKDYICLLPNSNILDTYPICKKDNKNVSYHLIVDLEKRIDSKFYNNLNYEVTNFNDITVYNLNNKTYLVWNYNGLDIINKENMKTIKMFETDIYDTSLAYLLNDYFIIPFYEDEFRFNAFNLYNLKTGDLTVWKLNKNIYYDSYILGKNNKSLFLFDRKEKKEYEVVPHKQKIRTISPKVLENGKWKYTNKENLSNTNVIFTEKELVEYKIVDNKLYKIVGDYKELISNYDIKEIVSYDNEEVYYIVEDSLYLYNVLYGEVKLLTNFEWNFNFKNKIFVY